MDSKHWEVVFIVTLYAVAAVGGSWLAMAKIPSVLGVLRRIRRKRPVPVATSVVIGERKPFSSLAPGTVFRASYSLVEWEGLAYGVKGLDGKIYPADRIRQPPGFTAFSHRCKEAMDPLVEVEVVGMVEDPSVFSR